MIVVGIDPGYANLGLVRLRLEWAGQGFRCTRSLLVKTKAKTDFHSRLAEIHRQVNAQLLALRPIMFLQNEHCIVACEEQTLAQEGNRQRGTTNAEALRVREVVGMIRGMCIALDFPFVEPTPAQGKAVWGKIPRTASKAQVARAVRAFVTGCPEKLSEHETDAMGIAIAGARIAHGQRVLKAMKR